MKNPSYSLSLPFSFFFLISLFLPPPSLAYCVSERGLLGAPERDGEIDYLANMSGGRGSERRKPLEKAAACATKVRTFARSGEPIGRDDRAYTHIGEHMYGVSIKRIYSI